MRKLVADQAPGLKLYARSLGADPESAEDVVADAFAGLWQQLARGRTIDSPAAYLAQTVRHGVARGGRRDSRRRQVEGAAALADWFDEEPDRERAAWAATLLQTLTPEQREIVILRIWAEMTFQEIATALDIPLSTAGHRYRTALATLRERETHS